MDRATIRHTLIGAAIGGLLFGSVSVYRSVVAGGDLLGYVGPVGVFTLIGLTVGGLVGPLGARALTRRRGGRGGEAAGAPPDADGEEPIEAPRPPLWVHLVAGAAVGAGIGSAWGRLWIGVGLGLVLALVARRIFRR